MIGYVLIILGIVVFFWLLSIGMRNSYGEIRTDGTGCPECGRDPKLCGYAAYQAMSEEEKKEFNERQNKQIENVITSIG